MQTIQNHFDLNKNIQTKSKEYHVALEFIISQNQFNVPNHDTFQRNICKPSKVNRLKILQKNVVYKVQELHQLTRRIGLLVRILKNLEQLEIILQLSFGLILKKGLNYVWLLNGSYLQNQLKKLAKLKSSTIRIHIYGHDLNRIDYTNLMDYPSIDTFRLGDAYAYANEDDLKDYYYSNIMVHDVESVSSTGIDEDVMSEEEYPRMIGGCYCCSNSDSSDGNQSDTSITSLINLNNLNNLNSSSINIRNSHNINKINIKNLVSKKFLMINPSLINLFFTKAYHPEEISFEKLFKWPNLFNNLRQFILVFGVNFLLNHNNFHYFEILKTLPQLQDFTFRIFNFDSLDETIREDCVDIFKGLNIKKFTLQIENNFGYKNPWNRVYIPKRLKAALLSLLNLEDLTLSLKGPIYSYQCSGLNNLNKKVLSLKSLDITGSWEYSMMKQILDHDSIERLCLMKCSSLYNVYFSMQLKELKLNFSEELSYNTSKFNSILHDLPLVLSNLTHLHTFILDQRHIMNIELYLAIMTSLNRLPHLAYLDLQPYVLIADPYKERLFTQFMPKLMKTQGSLKQLRLNMDVHLERENIDAVVRLFKRIYTERIQITLGLITYHENLLDYVVNSLRSSDRLIMAFV